MSKNPMSILCPMLMCVRVYIFYIKRAKGRAIVTVKMGVCIAACVVLIISTAVLWVFDCICVNACVCACVRACVCICAVGM